MSRAHGVEWDDLFSKIIHARADQFYQEVLFVVVVVLTVSLAAASWGARCSWSIEISNSFLWSIFFPTVSGFITVIAPVNMEAVMLLERRMHQVEFYELKNIVFHLSFSLIFMENMWFFSKSEMGLRLAKNSQSWYHTFPSLRVSI